MHVKDNLIDNIYRDRFWHVKIRLLKKNRSCITCKLIMRNNMLLFYHIIYSWGYGLITYYSNYVNEYNIHHCNLRKHNNIGFA